MTLDLELQKPVENPAAEASLTEQLAYEFRWAEQVAKAGILPDSLRSTGAVMALKQTSTELEIPFMMAAQHFSFIRGSLFIGGEMALALIRRSGKCRPNGLPDETMTGEPGTLERACVIKVWRTDREEPKSFTYSLQDAVSAGLAKLSDGVVEGRTKSGWSRYVPWGQMTDNQLYWRCVAKMRRREFSDVVNFGIREESVDHRVERDITPRKPPSGVDPLVEKSRGGESPEAPSESEEKRSSPAPEEAEPCTHPDGFAVDSGSGMRICIHCKAIDVEAE